LARELKETQRQLLNKVLLRVKVRVDQDLIRIFMKEQHKEEAIIFPTHKK
jgi:hypothetical protein